MAIVLVEIAVLLLLGLGREDGPSRWWLLAAWPVLYFGGLGIVKGLAYLALQMTERDPGGAPVQRALIPFSVKLVGILWPIVLGIGVGVVFVLHRLGIDTRSL